MDKVDESLNASVLLSFQAENVRSFRGDWELSLLATSLAEKPVVRRVVWRSGGRTIGVLPVACIYGANASGKSNILRAMADMRELVLQSFRLGSPGGGVPRRPFLLDPEARRTPSRFEVDLVVDGVRHGYGFVVDDQRVVSEWATRYPHGRAALLFNRTGDEVELGAGNRARGQAVKALLRPNALFLSTAASAAHPDLLPLYTWFERNLLLADARTRTFRQAVTRQLLDDEARRSQVLALLQAADLGIIGANRHEMDPVMQERMQRAVRILSGREDDDSSPADILDFETLDSNLVHRGAVDDIEMTADDESLGTLVWFGLIGPVLQALAQGTVLLADELDASLHPALVSQLVQLFQDPETNPRHAQLIFNSHDVTLMGDSVTERLIGRDQVWFTEKYSDGNTHLFALADLDPRKEEAIARRYLAGRYGAIPILSSEDFAAATAPATSGRPT
ncbi:AAA family ATPase [Actinacidiphila epipremni]|uniref:ATP-binding protein n=1 Tax=Actinacidiphila epipremni TaxID=2053013 RepID=A0ABX0ZQI5_9ACTN|nr:ATP-binding protein [Actinacidiphila epipremni]NJP43918.1 ATP-binding protein [Actinacidiphila epipremni]